MLRKDKLLNIPVMDYPKIKKPKELRYYHLMPAAVQVRVIKGLGRIFNMDIYDSKDKALCYRVFADKDNVITYKLKANEWDRCNIQYLLPSYNYKVVCCEADDEKARIFFGKRTGWRGNQTAYNCVYATQSSKVEKAKERTLEKREARILKALNSIATFPKGAYKWADKELFQSYVFIFGKKTKQGYKAKCGECGFKFTTMQGHGETERCPNCKRKANVYRGRYTAPNQEKKVWITQKNDNKIILLACSAEKRYNLNYEPKINFYKEEIYWLNNSKIDYCLKLKNVIFSGWQWKEYTDVIWSFFKGSVFKGNITSVFGREYKHTDIKSVIPKADINLMCFLENLNTIPAAERLAKMGLTRMASELWYSNGINPDGKDFKDITGAGKDLLQLLRKINGGVDALQWFKDHPEYIKYGEQLDVMCCGEYAPGPNLSPLKYMSITKYINYFLAQAEMSKYSAKRNIEWYLDYAAMCKRLRIDFSKKDIRFPKNLKGEHDRLAERITAIEEKGKDRKFKQAIKKHFGNLPTHESDTLILFAAGGNSDLIREGQVLHHCVGCGTYFNRCINGESMIFFVRSKENKDKPLYTAEIDLKNYKLRQLYGAYDKSAPQSVEKFVKGFINKYKKERTDKLCQKSA